MLVEAKDIGDGVRILTLNRPPANAISREFNEALYDRCREASDNKAVRAIIVTGIGKFFSGGLISRRRLKAPTASACWEVKSATGCSRCGRYLSRRSRWLTDTRSRAA